MSTYNQLDLQTLGFQPIVPKTSPITRYVSPLNVCDEESHLNRSCDHIRRIFVVIVVTNEQHGWFNNPHYLSICLWMHSGITLFKAITMFSTTDCILHDIFLTFSLMWELLYRIDSVLRNIPHIQSECGKCCKKSCGTLVWLWIMVWALAVAFFW
jgi:hypothetical protein